MTEANAPGRTRSNDQAKMLRLRTKSSETNITMIVPAKARLKRTISAALCVQNIERPEESGMVGYGLAEEPISQSPAIAFTKAGPSPKYCDSEYDRDEDHEDHAPADLREYLAPPVLLHLTREVCRVVEPEVAEEPERACSQCRRREDRWDSVVGPDTGSVRQRRPRCTQRFRSPMGTGR